MFKIQDLQYFQGFQAKLFYKAVLNNSTILFT